MIGIVMATTLEAEPFISGLGLRQSESQPFAVFSAEQIVLIISGIGKANAAIATTYLIIKDAPDTLYNLGAAGGLDSSLALGECLNVGRVVEPDRLHLCTGKPLVHAVEPVDGFNGTTLATMDRVVHEPVERDALSRFARIVDMEGAGVTQACSRLGKKCALFKFVSDTREEGDIVENIVQWRDRFLDFFLQEVLNKFHGIPSARLRRLTRDPFSD